MGRPPESPPVSSSRSADLPPSTSIASSSSYLAAQPDPIQPDQIEVACEADECAEEGMRWAVHFRDGHGEWISGRLHHSPASRWTTLLDMDNDVRAGEHVATGDQVTVGSKLRIDI